MESKDLRYAKTLLAIQEVMMAPEWFSRVQLEEILSEAVKHFNTLKGDLWEFEERFLSSLFDHFEAGITELKKNC